MADSKDTPGAMPETTENGRDAQPAEREAEGSTGLEKALNAERKARQSLERQLKQIEAEKEASHKADLEKRGEFETLRKRLESELQAEKAAKIQILKEAELRKLAEKFINPDLIDEAIEKAAKQFEYENGALSGNQTPDEWFTELVKAKRVYAKQAVPGAMKGTTSANQAGMRNITRAELSNMSPAEAANSMRAVKAGTAKLVD